MDNLNGIFIIDCSEIHEKPLEEIQDTEEFLEFSNKFGNGMKLNGIVYLINTGIDEETIAKFEEKLAEFYALPIEQKELYEKSHFECIADWGSWGWKGPNKKVPHDTKEFIDFTSNPRFEEDSMYPKGINGFKEALLAFRLKTKNISTKLLRSLGEYFQLNDKDFFIKQHSAKEENFEKSNFSVRSLYYPIQADIPQNSTDFRLKVHQDLNTMSYLCQNSGGGGGLQARLHNGKWVDVEYVPNSFVVNGGTSLEMWTGGNIPAVFHRVVYTERTQIESRISFGCFLGPDRDAYCLPCIEENPLWTTTYTKMQPGESYNEYFKQQIKLLLQRTAT